MRVLAVFIGFLLLSGCAGSPVADAILGPEKLAAQDDAYCKSIGLVFGTSQYAGCRMVQSQGREERHAASLVAGDTLLAAAAAGAAAAQPQYPTVQPLPNILPQQTRCQTYGGTTTNCTTY